MWNDPSGADPDAGDGDKLTGSATPVLKNEFKEYEYLDGSWSGKKVSTELDTVSVIHNRPIAAVTDGALAHYGRISSVQYIEKLKTDHNTVIAMREFKAHQQMVEKMRLNERHIGYDWRTGKDFNISIQQIKDAEYQKNEAGGAAIRNGSFAAGGALLYSALGKDPMRGAQVWSVVDGAAMSFSGVGTPYGKLGSSQRLNSKSLANTSMPQYPGLISNKFPTEPIPAEGKAIPFEIINGNIKGVNGQRNFDFVINKHGELLIGNKHHFLGGAQGVLAAGQLRLNGQGQIRTIDNQSGHYQPTVSESANYGQLFKAAGLNTKGATLESYTFLINNNNFIVGKPKIFSRIELKHK